MQGMRRGAMNITERYFILLGKNDKLDLRFQLILVGLVLIKVIEFKEKIYMKLCLSDFYYSLSVKKVHNIFKMLRTLK